MPAERPLSVTECEVSNVGSIGVDELYVVVSPYRTCESDGTFVVQLITADVCVNSAARTSDIAGGGMTVHVKLWFAVSAPSDAVTVTG